MLFVIKMNVTLRYDMSIHITENEHNWEILISSLKNTTQIPIPGLKPGPHDLQASALTMRLPRLLFACSISKDINLSLTEREGRTGEC